MTLTLAPEASADEQTRRDCLLRQRLMGRAWDYPTKRAAEATSVSLAATPTARSSRVSRIAAPSPRMARRSRAGLGPDLASAMKDALTKLGGGYIDTWACN